MRPDIVLGLDPATRASGWAVLAVDGHAQTVRGSGVYHARGEDRLGQLAAIYEWALGLVDQWAPAVVAVESVYFGINAQTTIRLAEVGAVVRLAASHAGAVVVDIAPAARVGAVGLQGQPGKAAITKAVNLIFGLDLVDDNEADAIAIASAGAAILHGQRMGLAGLSPGGRP